MLQCAVLSIFPYSTKIESDVIEIVEIYSFVVTGGIQKKRLQTAKKPSYIRHLSRSEARIQVAVATSELAQRLQCQSIENFSDPCRTSNSTMLADAIFLLKCAAFWRSGDITALDAAVQYVSSTKLYAQPLLTLLLKKLTTPSDGKTKCSFLQTCVPRVLQIYEALSSTPQLKPVRIRLLADLWKIEDLLIADQTNKTEEFLVAKATAIDIICMNRSDKYGAELLSVISDLLNSSLGKLSANSATIATLHPA
uniref:DUF3730 domain-containing protein n=1 Tax=Daphnia galeata TaxID=27404 RepID=A0A8J2WKF2_9CRUS|nr:unnamed protein product [Daphnia galeata]